MKKVKLVIVINDFLIGGAQRLTVDLISKIDRTKFELVLITLFQFPGRADMYDLLPKDMKIYRMRFFGFLDVMAWGAFIRICLKENPRVVLSNLFFANTISRIVGFFLRYKVIAVEHNTYIHKKQWQQIVDRVLARVTYALVAVSESVKDFTVEQEHLPEKLFRVIPNGIDTKLIARVVDECDRNATLRSLGLSGDKKYILNVARLAPQKNHLLLLEGFKLFVQDNPNYELLLIGDGGLMDELRNKAVDLGIEESVHFFGSQSDVYRFYCVSDYFVSTSDIEGFGIAHAEALAAGIPVATTKTAGPDKMIQQGENGLFIYERTPEEVARVMSQMIALGYGNRTKIRETVFRYDIQNTVQAYERLVSEAAESR